MTTEFVKEEELANLPSNLRKQVKEAEKLQAELNKAHESKEEVMEPETKKPEEKQPETIKPEEPERKQDQDNEDWKHKYNVLQGMIKKKDSDLNQMRSDIQKLKEDLDSEKMRANKIVDALQSKHQSDEKAPVKPATKSINPEQFEDYGEEMIEMVNMVNTLIEQNKELKSEVENSKSVKDISTKVENIEKKQAMTDEERYLSQLYQLVPDWDKINTDSKFHEFLLEEDPLNGRPRQDFLSEADKRMDANRVANFFNIFKNRNGVSEKEKNKGLEAQLVPDNAGSTTIRKDPDRITDTQLEQAARDVARNKIKPEQYDELFKKYQKQMSRG